MRRWFSVMACSLMLGGVGCSSAVDEEAARPPGEATPPETAANDAVPSGATLRFESGRFDLSEVADDDDDDADYEGGEAVSLVVPVGWPRGDNFLGLTFEPPIDVALGDSTRVTFSSGCDGFCEPGDWEERLNGPDGLLTTRTAGAEVLDRRGTSGSAGTVLITEEESAITVLVLRWDDSVDHFFECEAVLDDGAHDLAPAFEAACLAARPDWFPVG